MLFYLINYIFILGLSLIFGRYNNARSKVVFISFASLFMIIESSIRSITVGLDTPNYVYYFNEVIETPWSDIFNQFVARYVLRTEDMDIGFFILIKLISMFTHSFQWYSFIAAFIFFIPMGIFLYRYTTDFLQLALALVFFVSLFLVFPLSGMRQIQAMGFGIMAFLCVEKGKTFRAILYVLVGALLHFSLLLIIPYIILNYIKPQLGKVLHLWSFFLFPIVLFFTNYVIMMLGNATGLEKYQAYGEGDVAGGATTFVFLLIVCSYFCYVGLKKDFLAENPSIQKLYMVLPFMTVLGPLIQSNGAMIRISMYYHFYLLVLIPYTIDQLVSEASRRQVYALTILLLVTFSLLGASFDYDFYWNDTPGTW